MHLPETGIKYSFLSVILPIWNLFGIDASQQRCISPVVVEIGSRLKTQCEFEAFHALDWFYGRDEANTGSPFIYYEDSVVNGSGYISGEFDISLDGSLIIKNASLSHDRTFTVKYYKATDFTLVIADVEIKVLVPPEPRYPVVEINLSQRKVANLSCSLKRVWPDVGLEMVIVNENKDILTGTNNNYTIAFNGDGTFDLDVVRLYVIEDSATNNLPIVQCKLLQPIYEAYLRETAVAIPVVAFIPSALPVPVIDGCYSQQDHCSLRADNVGEVTCTVKGVDADFHLDWETDTTNTSTHFFFTQTSNQQNGQKSIIASYITTENTLQSVNLKCVMSSSKGIQSVAVVTLRINSDNSTAENHSDPCISDKTDPPKPIELATVHLLWLFIVAVVAVVALYTVVKIRKSIKKRKRKKMLIQLFAEHLEGAMLQKSQDDGQTGANHHPKFPQRDVDDHSIQQVAGYQSKRKDVGQCSSKVIGSQTVKIGKQLGDKAYWNMMISQFMDRIPSTEGSGVEIQS